MDPIIVSGLTANQPTLALANVMRRVPGMSGASAYVDSPFVVQVTPVGVSVLEMDPELGNTSFIGSLILEESPWKNKRVVAASVNASQVVIALEGGVILYFNLDEHGHLQRRQQVTTFPYAADSNNFPTERKLSMMRSLVYPASRWTLLNHTRPRLWLDFGVLTVYRSSAPSTVPAPSNIYVPANPTHLYLDPCYYITLGQVTIETNRITVHTSWSDWQTVR